MIDVVLSLFFFIAIILGFATALRVLFFQKKTSESFFLGTLLSGFAIISLYNFYLSVNGLKNFPDLFVTTKAFVFLIAPCSLLYVRNALFSITKFQKYDWLHFLPFIIYFCLTFIVWLADVSVIKFAGYMSSIVKNPFNIFNLTVWLLYALIQTMIILNYDQKKICLHENVKNISWLRIYNLVILCMFSALFVYNFLTDTGEKMNFASYILISSVSIFTCGWLYFKPYVFDGANETSDFEKHELHEIKASEVRDILPLVKEFTPDKRQHYLLKLNTIFCSKQLFLRKDLVIRDLSEETDIAVHQLSNLINSEYNLHFQDYVNLKRIEYFKSKIKDPDWKDLSLEGMAWASGFKSRTTCFRAFIKHTGKSPSEYFKTTKEDCENKNVFYLKSSS